MKKTEIEKKKMKHWEITDIKYDEPIEVNKKQIEAILKKLAGVVAYRIEGEGKDKKFFVKLWEIKYTIHLVRILNKYE